MPTPLPEILIDAVAGPILTFLHSDSVSSSSLYINANNQLVAMSGSTIIPMVSAATASVATTSTTASYVSQTTVLNSILGSNVVSSSAQTLATLQGTNVLSSSAQLSNGGGVAFGASNNLTLGQLTASAINVQTLFVQTITSSVNYASGSNVFGANINSTHQFTGSVFMTGSLTVVGPINGTVSNATSASYATTASFASTAAAVAYGNVTGITTTSTFAGTSSYATTAQAALSANAVAYGNVTGITTTSTFAGTASYATTAGTALSANAVAYGNVTGITAASTFAGTASFATTAATASLTTTAQTASFISLATHNNAIVGTGIASSSAQVVSFVAGQQISPAGVTSSLFGTSSWATNSTTAVTANAVAYGNVTGITSTSTFSGTASYATTAATASFVVSAQTASFISLATHNNAIVGTGIASSSAQVVGFIAGQQVSATGVTASFVGNLTGTASWATNAVTATTATTANAVAYANVTGITNTSTFAGTASLASTASYITLATHNNAIVGTGIASSSAQVVGYLAGQQISATGITASFVGNVAGTASWATTAVTANGVAYANITGITAASQFAGTASFASMASTASYVNLRPQVSIGYAEAVSTNTTNVSSANVWTNIGFDTSGTTNATDWTYASTAGSTFTCQFAGTYRVSAGVFMQKTAGTSTVGGIRITKNGVELLGSVSTFTFASNNVVNLMTAVVIETFAVSDVIGVQIIGGTTSVQMTQTPAIGSITTRPSATIQITRA